MQGKVRRVMAWHNKARQHMPMPKEASQGNVWHQQSYETQLQSKTGSYKANEGKPRQSKATTSNTHDNTHLPVFQWLEMVVYLLRMDDSASVPWAASGAALSIVFEKRKSARSSLQTPFKMYQEPTPAKNGPKNRSTRNAKKKSQFTKTQIFQQPLRVRPQKIHLLVAHTQIYMYMHQMQPTEKENKRYHTLQADIFFSRHHVFKRRH